MKTRMGLPQRMRTKKKNKEIQMNSSIYWIYWMANQELI